MKKKIVFFMICIVCCITFCHLMLGVIGMDIGTFELLELIFGLSKALDIWWADSFDAAYFITHIVIISIGMMLMGILESNIYDKAKR